MRLLTAATLLAAPGCAPLGVASALDEAEQALVAATEAGAEARAAYPWWSARAYLDLARTADGHADFEGAATFAKRARAFAVEARRAATTSAAPGAKP
ncbi:MAG: hypothetical protein CVU56_14615 [Deltaproteobacteria bacterium HGW-Deltaproteobacteria-14]|nr:MAG: hypothetical protein CVU56_14615 [Deltaproteobacteria bacterium HGW-Deltaproteobacteria-14]